MNEKELNAVLDSLSEEDAKGLRELLAKYEEYRQVAALLCVDIDIVQGVSKQQDITKEDLIAQINFLKEQKDEMTTDPEVRQSRFSATAMLFGAF